jgi:hypothetical protein
MQLLMIGSMSLGIRDNRMTQLKQADQGVLVMRYQTCALIVGTSRAVP